MPTIRAASRKTQSYLVVDVETNTFQKGNPFSRCGKLVIVGCKSPSETYMGMDRQVIQEHIDKADLLIGFNFKFDLHWLQNYALDFSSHPIYDCQLAHFILTGQSDILPSLNDLAFEYGFTRKLDMVRTEYWDKGIDTEDIPEEVLQEYLLRDLLLTEEVYHHQLKLFEKEPQLYKLFKLHCLDLLVLQEMEYNGMLFNVEQANLLAIEEEKKQEVLLKELQEGYEDIPINFQSRDHLSAYLYGGSIIHETRMPIGVYKTGAKTGLPRYKIVEYTYQLPQLVQPLKGSELKKEGYYATDEGTLKSIRCSKQSRKKLDLLLERSKSSKLLGTYYRGIPELIKEMDWPDGRIHGNFNQCIASTGRLSSSKPNLQNFAGQVDRLLKSRYP